MSNLRQKSKQSQRPRTPAPRKKVAQKKSKKIKQPASRSRPKTKSPTQNLREFGAILEIMQRLRGPDGCPWDREQDHRTLAPYAIEETFELVEAIESGSKEHLVEELGDVLFQVVFHSQMASEAGEFTIEDVLQKLCEKMIRRHPHVFGDTKVQSSSDVLKNWHKIKEKEKPNITSSFSFQIPVHLPALDRAQKIGKKTERLRFDWKDVGPVFEKLEEEINELKAELENQGSQKSVEHEVGDVLFTVAQISRHLKINAEQSLREANRRFEKRFGATVQLAKSRKQEWETLGVDEKEELWREVKILEKNKD